MTSSPAGIDCGSTCSASFDYNQSVTLAAAADAGSTFTGWSGEGRSGTGACQVTMTQARSVGAAFAAVCTAVTLSNQTITTTQTYTSCSTLTAGPAFRVRRRACGVPGSDPAVRRTVLGGFRGDIQGGY